MVYNPNGLKFEATDADGKAYTETITAAELKDLRVKIRIDIYNSTPFSRFAQEQALEIALMNGFITFEEYVSALDDNGIAPKSKFEQILKSREPMDLPFDLQMLGGMPDFPPLPADFPLDMPGGAVV